MKVALICDTHYGKRSNNLTLLENTEKFFENVFFPRLEKDGIKHIIHLGDLVDERKNINFNTANVLRTSFLEEVQNRGIFTHIINGNHDVYYKDTNRINSLKELVGNNYSFIEIYTDYAEEITLGRKILLVPWISPENDAHIKETMKISDASICLGHFDIIGFEMGHGQTSIHGFNQEEFSKFDFVGSGHYHHKSNNGNIHYLGSHSEFTWSDYDDARGFHIFDTETLELTFVRNPYTLFYKHIYTPKNSHQIDFNNFSNKYVRIYTEGNRGIQFDAFLNKVEQTNPVRVDIIDNSLSAQISANSEMMEMGTENTPTIFKNCISSLENIDENSKTELTTFLLDLYQESSSL